MTDWFRMSVTGLAVLALTAPALASVVSDLEGARAAGPLEDMERRGFRTVDRFESGSNGAGTVWWNGRTRQCLQVITVDGHIEAISDIQTHPRCR